MGIDVILTGIIGLISTIVSGWAGYFFTRRKYYAEVDNDLIENMLKTLDFYMKLSDDNSRRLEKILLINEELEKEVSLLKNLVKELTEQLKKYRIKTK